MKSKWLDNTERVGKTDYRKVSNGSIRNPKRIFKSWHMFAFITKDLTRNNGYSQTNKHTHTHGLYALYKAVFKLLLTWRWNKSCVGESVCKKKNLIYKCVRRTMIYKICAKYIQTGHKSLSPSLNSEELKIEQPSFVLSIGTNWVIFGFISLSSWTSPVVHQSFFLEIFVSRVSQESWIHWCKWETNKKGLQQQRWCSCSEVVKYRRPRLGTRR